jgi:hypothetical protein
MSPAAATMLAMPLQNRVTPTGEIVAHPGRGLLMGNRGCLHNADRQLGTTRWRSKLWICCVLDWKGVQRDVMPPGRWTALFFLDEATALSAGHRPCAYCRRPAYLDFAERWRRAHGQADRPMATEMDAVLHSQRVEPRTRRQRTRDAKFGDVPDGAMVRYRGEPSLVRDGCVRPWSFGGYGVPIALTRSTEVDLLTPPATVATLAAGYRPILHPTAASN